MLAYSFADPFKTDDHAPYVGLAHLYKSFRVEIPDFDRVALGDHQSARSRLRRGQVRYIDGMSYSRRWQGLKGLRFS